ncbi:MAG: ABC transporter permease [Gemmatimonadales bacterium]
MRAGARPYAARVRDAVVAFAGRDLRVAVSYKLPFLLEIAGALFGLLTTWFVSKIVDPAQVPGGYFAFVVLGLMVAAFVDAGISFIASGLRQEQMLGTLEATIASGVPTGAFAVGLAAYPLAAGAVEAVVYGALALAIGARFPGASWSLALAAMVVGAVAFVGIGLVGAALVLVIQRAAGAVGWVVAMLGLAAGEFFPPRLLPGWLESLSAFSPFTWCLRIVRGAVLGGEGWGTGWRPLGVLVAMALGYAMLGIAALTLGLRAARRRGTLSGY